MKSVPTLAKQAILCATFASKLTGKISFLKNYPSQTVHSTLFVCSITLLFIWLVLPQGRLNPPHAGVGWVSCCYHFLLPICSCNWFHLICFVFRMIKTLFCVYWSEMSLIALKWEEINMLSSQPSPVTGLCYSVIHFRVTRFIDLQSRFPFACVTPGVCVQQAIGDVALASARGSVTSVRKM